MAPALQRRYSLSGQSPPDPVAQPSSKQQSPKLQALDTTVPNTPSCGLCDVHSDPNKPMAPCPDPGDSALADRGRAVSHHHMAGRMSAKRSATQLPSPSTPTTHELPPKIARLALGLPGMDMDALVDEGVFTDYSESESSRYMDYDCIKLPPSSPSSENSSLPEETVIEPFGLEYDSGVESLALTPVASPPPSEDVHVPTTLLTLPPEIRRQIYLNLPGLVLHYPLIYCLSTFNNNLQHPLASVSRQIRSEALAMIYSYNRWIVKLEFKMMYEAFRDWIIRLGDGAGLLRLVTIAVRGRLFKPQRSHSTALAQVQQNLQVAPVPGMPPPYNLVVEQYSPPDGDASFSIDLSEKYPGGKVQLVRNDGTKEAGAQATAYLATKVSTLWEKRQQGTLNGQDWVNMVDDFLSFAGWW